LGIDYQVEFIEKQHFCHLLKLSSYQFVVENQWRQIIIFKRSILCCIIGSGRILSAIPQKNNRNCSATRISAWFAERCKLR
tara:strand:- start:2595 stop:2837 length:243 start_codon:yes stop_codon:yes gene_type:complete